MLSTVRFEQANIMATTDLGLSWSLPPQMLALTTAEVHLWLASFADHSQNVQIFCDLLSEDERARAERFHFRKDREDYIVARGLLREILSRYLDQEPDRLSFCYNAYGKPFLAPKFGYRDLRFNLSHADGLALYAVTQGREVGIDVERIGADFLEGEVNYRILSRREYAALRSLPAHKRQERFLSFWTRKEAIVKAKGQGLALDPKDIEVLSVPEEAGDLLSADDNALGAYGCMLRQIDVGGNYVAAMAVEAGECSISWGGEANLTASFAPGLAI